MRAVPVLLLTATGPGLVYIRGGRVIANELSKLIASTDLLLALLPRKVRLVVQVGGVFRDEGLVRSADDHALLGELVHGYSSMDATTVARMFRADAEPVA